eukprot:2959318-Pleurochrysis_carterae.AAC.4
MADWHGPGVSASHSDGQPQEPQETNALTRAVHGRYGSEVRKGRNVVATAFLLGLARLAPRARKRNEEINKTSKK